MTMTILVTLAGFAVLAGLEPTPRQVAAAERAKRASRAPGRIHT